MIVKKEKCPSRKKHVIAMVKAFGDEPVCLKVVGMHNNLVELVGSDPNNTINFPAELVYVYEKPSFEALKAAYENQNLALLSDGWSNAGKFKGICPS